MQNSPFIEELASVGVHPEEVDFVLCTHLHVDHVGWNTKLLDGRWVPTFPNAKYIFSRNEFELWAARYEKGETVPVPLVYEDSVLPIVEAGQAIIVEDTHQIDDGMWLEPAPGHTPGHVSVWIESEGSRALITGDCIHHPVQMTRTDWCSSADFDQDQTRATRETLLKSYADSDVLIIGTHFATPTAGYIKSLGNDSYWLDVV